MSEIEFRRRRTEDDLEPFYVRIAARGDTRALAFSENSDSREHLDACVATLRGGAVTVDRLHDEGNGVWFFRFRSNDGDTVFRSMPCADEAAMEADIATILRDAPAAAFLDDSVT